MAVKPLGNPNIWAPDALFPLGGDPWSGNPNKITAPTQGSYGFLPNTGIISEYANQELNTLSSFARWVSFGVNTPDLDAHIIETDVNGSSEIASLTLGNTASSDIAMSIDANSGASSTTLNLNNSLGGFGLVATSTGLSAIRATHSGSSPAVSVSVFGTSQAIFAEGFSNSTDTILVSSSGSASNTLNASSSGTSSNTINASSSGSSSIAVNATASTGSSKAVSATTSGSNSTAVEATTNGSISVAVDATAASIFSTAVKATANSNNCIGVESTIAGTSSTAVYADASASTNGVGVNIQGGDGTALSITTNKIGILSNCVDGEGLIITPATSLPTTNTQGGFSTLSVPDYENLYYKRVSAAGSAEVVHVSKHGYVGECEADTPGVFTTVNVAPLAVASTITVIVKPNEFDLSYVRFGVCMGIRSAGPFSSMAAIRIFNVTSGLQSTEQSVYLQLPLTTVTLGGAVPSGVEKTINLQVKERLDAGTHVLRVEVTSNSNSWEYSNLVFTADGIYNF